MGELMRTDANNRTLTIQIQQTPENHRNEERVVLRLVPRKKKKVSWDQNTVDNEHLNKKSSKICCIFHKEKPFDEASSDEDGDSDKHDDKCCHRHNKENEHNLNEGNIDNGDCIREEDSKTGSNNGDKVSNVLNDGVNNE